MIRHDIEQGSQEWLDLHVGIPTASRFDKLVTPKTMKPSAQRRVLVHQLVAEQMTGEVLNDGLTTQFMQRGLRQEGQARNDYAFEHDVDVEQVGFVMTDDGLAGGSPDGLIGDDGGLEIKVPSPAKHVGYMLDPQSLVADYRHQIQGYLWVCGRQWWDVLSWSRPGGMPDVVQRVERDEEYIAALAEAVQQVAQEVDEILERFGYKQKALAGDAENPDFRLNAEQSTADPAAAFQK